MNLNLDSRKLYHLPWSISDNANSWIEPTSQCNIYCEACYRENSTDGYKSLEEIQHDLDVLQKLRKSDGISIAGGEPLLHPDIVKIVQLIAMRGWKPNLHTNGIDLTPVLLLELKKAGLSCVTLHIDSKQHRPGYEEMNEVELNELRLYFAEMLARVGGILCVYNTTVYEDTLSYVPNILKWAHSHIDIVHGLAFITCRSYHSNDYIYYAGRKQVDYSKLPYANNGKKWGKNLLSTDIYNAIRKEIPDFEFSAYLGGTEWRESLKWAFAVRAGAKNRIYGYTKAKFMELIQNFHHLFLKTYIAYISPKVLKSGRLIMLLSILGLGLGQIGRSYLYDIIKNPLKLFKKLYFQYIIVIQTPDILSDGRMNMCDGCPDPLVWNGRLVYSCRFDEIKHFGMFLTNIPKPEVNSK